MTESTKDYWVIDETQPEVSQACSLALAVLSHCSVGSWQELCDGLDTLEGPVYTKFAELIFTRWQEELLADFQPEFQYLTIKPLQSIATCPECERWIVVNSDVPKKCLVTLGCTGVPVKAVAAEKIEDDLFDLN